MKSKLNLPARRDKGKFILTDVKKSPLYGGLGRASASKDYVRKPLKTKITRPCI